MNGSFFVNLNCIISCSTVCLIVGQPSSTPSLHLLPCKAERDHNTVVQESCKACDLLGSSTSKGEKWMNERCEQWSEELSRNTICPWTSGEVQLRRYAGQTSLCTHAAQGRVSLTMAKQIVQALQTRLPNAYSQYNMWPPKNRRCAKLTRNRQKH